MQLTAVVSIRPAMPHDIIAMMRRFNAACAWLSQVAFNEKLFYWLPLQRRAYHELRTSFGLTSAQAVVAVRKVAYAYRSKGRRKQRARFRPNGGVPLYRHRYKRDGTVAFYGFRCPFRTQPEVRLSGKHEAILVHRDGRLFIQQVVEAEEAAPRAVHGYLGLDLGLANIATDSDGVVYSGGHLTGLRKRQARLRVKLQRKGTRAAKRLLRKRRRKERRFASWVNHNISKAVVATAHDTGRGIALEELQGIRSRITVRRAQRRNHHAWAFHQLRAFIEYKAMRVGVAVVIVNPRETSRTCPRCGLAKKANRRYQGRFSCVGCGFSGHADTIAAGNIARRAAGDQPDAASPDSCESLASTGSSPNPSRQGP